MQNIVTLGEINDALKIAAVSAAQLADMGFAALANKPICEGLPPEESRRLRNAKLYPAESIGQIRVALAQRFAEPTTAADVPASGAAALSAYLKTCEQHQIVPDVGGAFASAFAAGFNLASSQAAQREATAAIKTLQNLGYTYHDAELWKPPIGKVPDFDLVDSLRNRISELEASQAAPAAVAVPMAEAWELSAADTEQQTTGAGQDYNQGLAEGMRTCAKDLRAALAATPAAAPDTLRAIAIEELAQLGYTFDGDKMMPPDFVGELMHVVQAAPCGCREGTCETKPDRACRMTAEIATNATPATAKEHELIDWDSAHKIAFQAAAAFRPSYFNGTGFMAHNWVVEAIRSGHIDGQRHALGLPPIDRSGAHAAKLRLERNAATPAAAPVVLPEPVAVVTFEWRKKPDVKWLIDTVVRGTKLYTEQQVRTLLATATGLPAQEVDADSLKLLADIRSMAESTIKAGLVDDRELLHTFETIVMTAAKAKRPICAICDSKGFIAFDDEQARGRNGGKWGVCKACATAAPQAQADARDVDDADLIEWLSGQYLAADFQWGDPKTPVLVIEIPPTTSVCGDFRTDVRAAIAAAKGE